MDLYHCPFCPFTDHDSLFLIQHVGQSHPENDDSPFIPKDDMDETLTRPSAEGMACTRGAPSDGGYIECECGETGTKAGICSYVQAIDLELKHP